MTQKPDKYKKPLMKKLMLLSVIFPLGLFAQVTDDFSDGDLSQNPCWSGDTSQFKISYSTAVPSSQRPALQLDADTAGAAAISAPAPLSGELEWKFWVKLSFNTSSGNFARFYLLSDKADLKAPLHGYFLQIGGADDSVTFFRQDSLENTGLLRLQTAFTGNSTNSLRFRILRSNEGNWKFYCDSLGSQSLTLQGEIDETEYSGGNYAGMFCQYTSSNTTKIYFDDIYAGPLIVDHEPPELLEAGAVTPTEVRLLFSEAVDLSSAEDTSLFEILPDIGHPYDAVRLLDPAEIHLFFDNELQNGQVYTLNISPVKDLAGNLSSPFTISITYYRIRPYDLIFTEIMADPSPPRELPEYEYLEVYNRSPVPLNIGGLILTISSTEHILPSLEIDAWHYLLFCADDALEIMQHVAPAVGLSSFVLPNSGTSLELTDTTGLTICYLQYDISWYKNDSKAAGGWSLEMIDVNNPCKSEENWTGSVQAEGGTPGRENSVSAGVSGEISILNACCRDDGSLLVEFSESLDSLAMSDPSLYDASPFLGHPVSAIPVPPDFHSVNLFFQDEIPVNQIFTLTVNAGLKNCVGANTDALLQVSFAISMPVQSFDIVINEVLFNPLGDGVDYVEFYNRSAKPVNLEEMILASVKENDPEQPDTQFVDISSTCKILFPGEYLVLTSDPELVKNQYYTENADAFFKIPSFPSYNNDKGCVLLLNKDGMLVDMMNYSEEMHYLMLLSYDGVALEKINPDKPGTDAANWHSAAETAGFGTPGYQNSQYLETFDASSSLTIRPDVFSPDGDGIDDNLGIAYSFDTPGKQVTVLIFNAEGRLVKTLVNNEMPGTAGLYTWDGTLDDRTAAQNGIYVIYLEALGMDGKTEHYKKAAVLARNR
jgi:hypothetical protein